MMKNDEDSGIVIKGEWTYVHTCTGTSFIPVKYNHMKDTDVCGQT
jgi:hypothetical protein